MLTDTDWPTSEGMVRIPAMYGEGHEGDRGPLPLPFLHSFFVVSASIDAILLHRRSKVNAFAPKPLVISLSHPVAPASITAHAMLRSRCCCLHDASASSEVVVTACTKYLQVLKPLLCSFRSLFVLTSPAWCNVPWNIDEYSNYMCQCVSRERWELDNS